MKDMSGEYETLVIKRSVPGLTPDGRKALLIETVEGRRLAFAIPQEMFPEIRLTLAKLEAAPAVPTKPNA